MANEQYVIKVTEQGQIDLFMMESRGQIALYNSIDEAIKVIIAFKRKYPMVKYSIYKLVPANA